jgi:hypothetical protein
MDLSHDFQSICVGVISFVIILHSIPLIDLENGPQKFLKRTKILGKKEFG